MTAVDDAPTTAGRREWLGLAALALPTFIVAIDLFVLLTALPSLAEDLHAGANEQLWITDIYGFVLAGFLVTMGTLGDRIGRRKLLLIGSVAFAVGSIVCAYSTSAEMLIIARAVLGIAGATLMPTTMGLIGALFKDPKQMAAAFGIFSGTFTLGAIFGPVIGGVLLAHFWWGSVFLLGVPFMVVLLIVGPKLLPEVSNPGAGRLDIISVVLSLAALLPTIYGIKELARHGWAVFPIVALVFGIVCGVLFVRRQTHLESPLLDLKLFKNRTVGSTLIGMTSYPMLGGGMMMLMLMYFQLVAGMSTLEAGLALVPGMITSAIGFQIAPKLAARFRPAYVIAGGLAGAAIGFGLMTLVSGDSDGATLLIVAFAVGSFFGVAMPGLGNSMVVSSAPPEQAGSAGSLAQMSNELGSTLGLALYGTIGAAVYRAVLELPSGVPADAAAAADDSLPGAAAAAAELPPDQAASVLDPARDAFASGVGVVAGIGGLVLLSMAAMIAIRLKHVPPLGQQEEKQEQEAEAKA